jgi:hypothetical protein
MKMAAFQNARTWYPVGAADPGAIRPLIEGIPADRVNVAYGRRGSSLAELAA